MTNPKDNETYRHSEEGEEDTRKAPVIASPMPKRGEAISDHGDCFPPHTMADPPRTLADRLLWCCPRNDGKNTYRNALLRMTNNDIPIVTGLLASFFAVVFMKELSLPYVLVLGVILFAGFLLKRQGFSFPEMILCLLIAYIPFSKKLGETYAHAGMFFNMLNLLVGILLCAAVWQFLTGPRSFRVGRPFTVSCLLFMGLGLISLVRTASYGGGFFFENAAQFGRVWVIPFLLYFLVFRLAHSRTFVRHLTFAVIFTTCLVAAMAVYEYTVNSAGESLRSVRIEILMDDPNLLGGFFTYYMYFPLAYFLLNIRRPKHWTWVLPLALCLRAVMVTFSRGAFLGVTAAGYAVAFFRSKILFVFLLAAGWIVLANPYLLPGGVRYRVGQTVETYASETGPQDERDSTLEASADEHVQVWQAALRLIRQNPLFGTGYGIFPKKVPHYWSTSKAKDTHNSYLLIAAEMGGPALLAFLSLAGIVFWDVYRLYTETEDPFLKTFSLGLLGGIAGFAVINFFVSQVESPEASYYFWILAALAARLRLPEKYPVTEAAS